MGQIITLRGREVSDDDSAHGERFLTHSGQGGTMLVFCANTELEALHQSDSGMRRHVRDVAQFERIKFTLFTDIRTEKVSRCSELFSQTRLRTRTQTRRDVRGTPNGIDIAVW